jgi:uncharacterized membrane protein YeiH
MQGLIVWLDALGVVVFAVTGGLTASRKELDIVGFVFVGTVTGVGGGTLRDLLLGRTPVFWIAEPWYLLLTSLAAILVYFTAPQVEHRYRLLLWADALGVSLYCVMGAAIALKEDVHWSVAIVMGVMTATMGGLLRDIVCRETPLILRPEVYATAAAVGAAGYVSALSAGLAPVPAAVLGFAAAFLLRGAALAFGLRLPVYRPRPGRDYPAR